ncbi:Isochorismatase-like protein [Coprinopsis sp. MPI-PUGE-AT-0042]|nr:Isochorismatase-like protein [Coprinopsis sp. MPI-PUGE-AT-0042]
MTYSSDSITSASSSSLSESDSSSTSYMTACTSSEESLNLMPESTMAKHVLLLLDIQCFMLRPPPVGVPSAAIVHKNIEELLSLARSSPHPPLIIHVRNTGDPGDYDEPGTDGWQLIFPLLPGEIVLDKRKNNAFTGTKLDLLISPEAEIVVAGFQTDFSVRATCGHALARGNEVILVKGAHATFDRIEVLHGGGVTAASTIENEIEEELSEAGE